jgi:hypothetical protein
MDQYIRKTLRLSTDKYYEIHLNLINCILPIKMTPREIEVIAAFMALEGDIATYRFGPSARKIVMAKLHLSPAGLSNFMKFLFDKGVLERQGDMIKIYPLLIPNVDEQKYLFKLVNLSTITVSQNNNNHE